MQPGRENVLLPLKEDSPSWADVQGCRPDGITLYPPMIALCLALAGKKVPETEIYIRNAQCPLGIWVAAQARPLRNGNGEIRGSVVAFHDITQKKETDTLVKTLTNAVEQTADSIIITDRAGVIDT
jgi:hypothetical protein